MLEMVAESDTQDLLCLGLADHKSAQMAGDFLRAQAEVELGFGFRRGLRNARLRAGIPGTG